MADLSALTRKPDRGGDRRLLDEVFDHCQVATLATVVDDEPWSVPILVARVGDQLLLHGSTGAGALRHAATGAKVAVSAFLLDGLVIADRAFDHSANYRSAVVRGVCVTASADDAGSALDSFTDALLPGRSAECPPHTAKEIAQTLLLALAITEDNWIAKQRSGPPGPPENPGWTGVIPVAPSYGQPLEATPGPLPESVRRLLA
ncbi:flavin-nucleotide-binding protein [Mycolicibacterium chitae]|uniref:Pyridoxamine 5'-phosphate oxidase-like protein n=1 Tax=Mycolicibacterium chitae TaxID=1792 RepID=A0A3S4TM91_MYCCI|nr:pyridoxamine 5'-phosphate oxidase family protein [Mycolicibacterium chitae]MCV7106675.1 pyridoxamine 5'-phosphate oxidase family protein [Mycolicibacterium chitae]BBZ04453.1 flavin-nucleotide-binding protein [Mycolicibacterium chitae]VEG48088.1 pyridoxamine 5'-phosphate oxidase-like protein [Mycolicibacterium chitae]